jgi:hypothetical protein
MPLSCCIQANWFCSACKASGQDKLPQRPQDLQGRARAPAHRPPPRPQPASAPPRPPAAQSGPQSGKKQDTSCISPAGLLAAFFFTEELMYTSNSQFMHQSHTAITSRKRRCFWMHYSVKLCPSCFILCPEQMVHGLGLCPLCPIGFVQDTVNALVCGAGRVHMAVPVSGMTPARRERNGNKHKRLFMGGPGGLTVGCLTAKLLPHCQTVNILQLSLAHSPSDTTRASC